MRAGDIFQGKTNQHYWLEDEFWVLLSDPKRHPQDVVVVKVEHYDPYVNAKARPHEQVEALCVLDNGDSPLIHTKARAAYETAFVTTAEALEERTVRKEIRWGERLRPKVLKRIRDASGDSRVMKVEPWGLLEDQGVAS